jgi:WD40 repeat protein
VSTVWDDHHSPISQIAWMPDGSHFATGSSDNFIWIYDLNNDNSDSLFRQAGAAGLAWSPEGSLLATAGGDGYVRLADAAGNERGALSLTTDLTSVAWTDEQTVAVGGVDGRIAVWPITARQPSSSMTRHASVAQLAWLPASGQLLSVGDNDQVIRLWQGVTATETANLFDFVGYSLATAVQWAPDNSRVAVGNDDGTIQVWSLETGNIVAVLGGHTSGVSSLAWSPDSRWLATSGRSDHNVRVWEAATGELMAVLEGHTAEVTAISWSADSKQVASTGFDSVLRIWNVAQEQQEISYQVNALGPALALTWSPDGAQIVVSGQTGLVQIRPPNRNERTITLDGHTLPVPALAWATDNSRFASGDNGGQLLVWETAVTDSSEPSLTIPAGGSIRHVTWAPDNSMLAANVGPTTRFWDTATGNLLYTLDNQHPFSGNSAWSPDGKLLATVGSDGLVQIWQVLGN